jgi:hypothetical protein
MHPRSLELQAFPETGQYNNNIITPSAAAPQKYYLFLSGQIKFCTNGTLLRILHV